MLLFFSTQTKPIILCSLPKIDCGSSAFDDLYENALKQEYICLGQNSSCLVFNLAQLHISLLEFCMRKDDKDT